jgi:excinuclease ABC subunit B
MAILYADAMTDSMRRAIGETERRRAKQVAFNAAHGILPKGVSKRIKDIIDGVYDADGARAELKAAEEQVRYGTMTEKELGREIKRLEKQMLDHARNLEFEKAAAVRDQLLTLKRAVFGAEGEEPLPREAAG